MKKVSLYVLAGDGIGPEVMKASWPVLEKALEGSGLSIEAEEGLAGGCSLEAHGVPLLPETLEKAKKADAVLLGAVGGPKWDTLPHEKRPERALLALRAGLGLFANIRPARVFSSLIQASTLKEEVIRGIDLLVVRELTGGIYFGEPRGREKIEGGFKAYNSEVYSTHEIVRIAKIAFEAAMVRGKKVMSVDKANILESSILWREVVTNMAKDYPDIQLDHMYVDNCAMQLVRNPRQFDVIVTNNIFGDILSDEAAMLTGSIGMLPSASLGSQKNSLGFPSGMYEPVHGSAPDIAGKNLANPLANILSIAMMMRHSLGLNDAATKIEKAVEKTLDAGYRTGDIFEEGMKKVGTKEMAAQVLSLL